MSLRDVVVLLDGTLRSSVHLDVAAWLARTHGAHVTGLCLLDLLIPATPASVLGAYPMVYPAEPIGELRYRAAGKAAELEARFRERLLRDGLNGDWELAEGVPSEEAVRRARSADLVVIGQRDRDDAMMPGATEILEDLLLEAGRPLLIVPYAGTFDAVGANVLIGWNDSAQSARAAHDVLPLLQPGAKATVLTVERPRGGGELPAKPPGAKISEHLARHGIAVSAARTVNDGTISDADALLSCAWDIGADLLAVGGYGHSRRREILLGGVTRSLLDHMTLPVLMSH